MSEQPQVAVAAAVAPRPLRHVVRANLGQRHKVELLGTLVVSSAINAGIELHLAYEWLGFMAVVVMLIKDSAIALLIAEEKGLI